MKTTELIDNLVLSLHPVQRVPSPNRWTIAYCLGAFAFVSLGMVLTLPFRNGFLYDLIQNPRFLLETLCFFAVPVISATLTFCLGIPGYRMGRLAYWLMTGAGIFLLGSVIMGLLFAPALPPSMVGKRPHCVHEVLLYGAVLFAISLLLLKKLAPTRLARTALFGGLMSTLPAAAWMQVACMVAPEHVLQFHLLPAALLCLGCTAVGKTFLRW